MPLVDAVRPAYPQCPGITSGDANVQTVKRRWVRLLPLGATAALLLSCTGTTGQQVRTAGPKSTTTTSSTAPAPDCAESLPPSAKAGQLLMVMVTSPDLAAQSLKKGMVGGFGLKGPQPKDVGTLIKNAVAEAAVAPFVASEEEGGTVQRLTKTLGGLPSAAEMAKSTPEAASRTMGEYATRMKDLGFNMLFGPVLNVVGTSGGSGSGLASRSFGKDPTVVSSYSTAIIKAVQDAGLISVAKYWPGVGAGKDGSESRVSTLAPINELRHRDILPFSDAIHAGVSGVMVGHSAVPGLTDDGEPASMSSAAIIGELRGTEGFKGLVITDSLGLGSIARSMTQEEAAEKAVAAGADIALVSGADSVTKVHRRLTDAISSGRLDATRVDESVRRILSAKGISGPCPDLVASMTRLEQESSGSAPATSSQTGSSGPSQGSGQGSSGSGLTTSTIAPRGDARNSAVTTSQPRGRTGFNEALPD